MFTRLKGNLALLPAGTLFALWFTLGGHFVEVAFLRLIRPRIGCQVLLDIATRTVAWLVGGAVLGVEMLLTRQAMFGETFTLREVVIGDGVLVVIEIVVQGILAVRGKPNAFDCRGQQRPTHAQQGPSIAAP